MKVPILILKYKITSLVLIYLSNLKIKMLYTIIEVLECTSLEDMGYLKPIVEEYYPAPPRLKAYYHNGYLNIREYSENSFTPPKAQIEAKFNSKLRYFINEFNLQEARRSQYERRRALAWRLQNNYPHIITEIFKPVTNELYPILVRMNEESSNDLNIHSLKIVNVVNERLNNRLNVVRQPHYNYPSNEFWIGLVGGGVGFLMWFLFK